MMSHARYAAHTARVLGYEFRSLDGDDCYLFEVRAGERRALFPLGHATPYALNRAHAYSLARDKSFATRVLAEAGLPTIPSTLFFANARQAAYRAPGREREDALAWAARAAFPMFMKPNQGSKGEFAEIIPDAAAFAAYLDRVGAVYDGVLAQPLLTGDEHRVIVLRGRALCAYRKRSPKIQGDGRGTLRTLLEAERAQWKSAARETPLSALQVRDRDGALYALDDTPPVGELVIVGRANRAAGGDADAIAAPAPEKLGALACAAARALDLDLAGVDIFDVSPARDGGELVIIEVNANPAVETLEAQGRFDLIERIWAANFEAALR